MSYQLMLAAGFAMGILLLLAAEIRYGLRGAGNIVLAFLGAVCRSRHDGAGALHLVLG